MTGRESEAALGAREWLCGLPLGLDDAEWLLQRLLGLRAAEVLSPEEGVSFVRFGADLRGFGAAGYDGDPLLAITMHRALHAYGISHEGLSSLVSVYARALMGGGAPTSELALVADLINRCGFEVPV